MNLMPYESVDLSSFLVAGKSWSAWILEYKVMGVTVSENVWLSAEDLSALQSAGGAAVLKINEDIVASIGASDGCVGQEVQAGKGTFYIQHVWDLLKANEQAVSGLATSTIEGEVHPLAVVEGEIKVGEGTRILPGVFIEGNVVIGKGCKVGPNCYIRGNTTIGDYCHIGNAVEIKNTMIGNNTNVGHLSYIGDSILGHGVNLGAGTIVSNLRHDGKNHRSVIEGKLVDTGRRKFGTVIADGVHTGINTSIYPGRKLGKSVTTRPGEVINSDKYI